jgi:hypothetical protein
MNVSQAAEAAAPRVSLRTRRRRWPDRRGDPRLLVGLVMIVGVILRIQVARQSLFGDELATYWIITPRRCSSSARGYRLTSATLRWPFEPRRWWRAP